MFNLTLIRDCCLKYLRLYPTLFTKHQLRLQSKEIGITKFIKLETGATGWPTADDDVIKPLHGWCQQCEVSSTVIRTLAHNLLF